MPEFQVIGNHLPKLADFYFGQNVFITGAGGFIGSVLLENLLRCCPGIKYIFILLRTKKNIHFEDRKEEIFNKKIFEKLKVKNKAILDKVKVIGGDISLPNLGMSEEDIQLLTKEVSIVFHCAASVSFTKSLKYTLENNVSSLSSIIELSRRMRNLKALVYTSTAYVNCNHLNTVFEEEVYRLPFRAEKFLDALKDEDDEKLQHLFSCCKPDWPNVYSFSKCLAENVLIDTASDLPIAIIRPSLVFSTWKHPIPGYDEGRSTIGAFSAVVGIGLVRVFLGDPSCQIDIVPADIVANAHVLAACCIGSERWPSALIINCTATEKLQITIKECSQNLIHIAHKYTFPRSFLNPTNVKFVLNGYLYNILTAYFYYLPAIILDGMIRISGKKPWVFSTYRTLDKMMKSVSFFQIHSFKFERKNLEHLDKLIHPDDRKDLSLDFKDATFFDIVSKIPEASPFCDWKKDKKSPSERQQMQFRNQIIVLCIHGIFISFSISLIWCLLAIFFNI